MPSLFGESILYSTLGIGSPAESSFWKKSVFPATKGEHSVKPYPCKVFKFNFRKSDKISGLAEAAPTINTRNLPPSVFLTLVFTIFFKKKGSVSNGFSS